MAEASKKPAKSEKSLFHEEKVTVKTVANVEKPEPMAVKAPAQMQTVPGPQEKAVQAKPASEPKAVEVKAKEPVSTPAPKPEVEKPGPAKIPQAEVKAEPKAESKKEADPNKEFVDGIMAEMALKGASKKRLIKTLVEQYGLDKQRVMFKMKRALITERYAAAHAEAGSAGH